jgi:hypothetical protein
LFAFAGVEFAAMPRVEISEAAALITRAPEKARLFIIMMSLPSMIDGNVWLHGIGGATAQTPEISMSGRRGISIRSFYDWIESGKVERHRAIE